MARLNDEGQWIIMLGFIISILMVFLALIVNQSALVGKTTSESVLEFPKSEIQDTRAEIMEYYQDDTIDTSPDLYLDINGLSLDRRGAIIYYDNSRPEGIFIHYNDGMTDYNEVARRI
jgi:hypothetical protein